MEAKAGSHKVLVRLGDLLNKLSMLDLLCVFGGGLKRMSGNRPYRILLLLCVALLLVSLGSATPISENFDNTALGVNGWTETGGNSATPSYNADGLGCCPSLGWISAKDSGNNGVMKLYAPLALMPQSGGFADLSSFDITRVICGVKWKVMGLENLPGLDADGHALPAILLVKHQSAGRGRRR